MKLSKFEHDLLLGLDDAAHNRLLSVKAGKFVKVKNYGKKKVPNCKFCKAIRLVTGVKR